jgi:hypothetical protein
MRNGYIWILKLPNRPSARMSVGYGMEVLRRAMPTRPLLPAVSKITVQQRVNCLSALITTGSFSLRLAKVGNCTVERIP